MDSRQAGNGGRLLTQQVLSAVVCELPVQGKLVKWQVGKQPFRGAGVLGGCRAYLVLLHQAEYPAVCVFVCVCVFVGRGWIAGRVCLTLEHQAYWDG